MPSIKSTALEPTAAELASLSLLSKFVRSLPVYGLPLLGLALAIIFSLMMPATFPTLLNLRATVSDKGMIALLSLAAMIPMVTGNIDLNVGYGIVLWHILAISLQSHFGLPWFVAALVVVVLGGLAGWVNGWLVEVAQIDSFIATLGTGTILYAIALWHTGGRQMVALLPNSFYAMNDTNIAGIPIIGFYVLVLSLALWVLLEYLPLGRFLYAIGANPKAAALNGIPVRRCIIGTFVASGALTAAAGVLLAAKLHIGETNVGLDFLLPALVGAFLGSTTIRPGRVNVWGTIVGVAVLAIGISGIQQLGGAFFVEPLFNGTTLLLAIGIAGYARRGRSSRKSGTKAEA